MRVAQVSFNHRKPEEVKFTMESPLVIYSQNMSAQPEQNRQTLLLVLLLKFALVLLLGFVYACIRWFG